jgi:CRP/FNR family transcriptional regulator
MSAGAKTAELVAALKLCHLFAHLPADNLQQLAALASARIYDRGQVLFSEGEPAVGFYVVASGRVKIYKLSAEGKERILHIAHTGDTFAEAAIFGDGRYPAFAETLSSCTLIYLPARDFLTLLHEQSNIAIGIIGGLSRFLRQFASQIEELTFKDVPARLAGYLLKLKAENDGSYQLPVSKSQLASNLGTVSETLSRSLRRLVDDELIKVEGKRIEILDRELLEELARQES